MMRSSRRTTPKKFTVEASCGSPVSSTRPPGWVSSSACSTATPVPAVSITRSTPSRPEKVRAASAAPAAPLVVNGAQAERAHAQARGRLAALRLAPRNGADDHRQRLSQHQLVVADLGRRRPAAAGRQAGLLGEASMDVDADRGAREAEVAVAF